MSISHCPDNRMCESCLTLRAEVIAEYTRLSQGVPLHWAILPWLNTHWRLFVKEGRIDRAEILTCWTAHNVIKKSKSKSQD